MMVRWVVPADLFVEVGDDVAVFTATTKEQAPQ